MSDACGGRVPHEARGSRDLRVLRDVARWSIAFVVVAVALSGTGSAHAGVPDDVVQGLIRQLRADVPEMRECLPAKGLPVEAAALDLAGDGRPAYLLTSIASCECGQVNCAQWVYRTAAPGFTRILATDGYRLSARPTRHHGLLDLEGESRGSAAVVDRRTYAFDGTGYRLVTRVEARAATDAERATTRRVRFAAGRDAALLDGEVRAGTGDRWVLGAREGQTLHLAPIPGISGAVVVTLLGPTAGDGVRSIDPTTRWDGVLPASGDYVLLIEAVGAGPVAYRLEVGISAAR